MEDDYEDINSLGLPLGPYSHFTRQQLINLFEEQKKKNEALSNEINKLKETIIINQINLGHKEKEIEMLNKRIEDKEKWINTIQKGNEDYMEKYQDMKNLVEKSNTKNGK